MNFDSYWASYKVISLRPKKSMENNLFQNKAFIPVKKKDFGLFCSHYRVWQTSINICLAPQSFLANMVQFKNHFVSQPKRS